MKMKKLLFALSLSLCCAAVFAACSGGNPPQSASIPERSPAASSQSAPESDAAGPDSGTVRVRMTLDGGEVLFVLEDNPAAKSLLEQLPATVTFSDYAGAEKIAYLPEGLSTEGAPEGSDPLPGDVACYGPWGNLVLYYEDPPYASGIIPMGRIESGLELLQSVPSGFQAVLEVLT